MIFVDKFFVPAFYLQSLFSSVEVNFDVLVFLPFHQCFTSVLPVFHQYFTSVYKCFTCLVDKCPPGDNCKLHILAISIRFKWDKKQSCSSPLVKLNDSCKVSSNFGGKYSAFSSCISKTQCFTSILKVFQKCLKIFKIVS